MLKKVLIGLVVVVGILVIVIATRPATFHIERSQSIAAPAQVVFPLVNDFRDWPAWSPWEKLDPNLKRMHSGAPLGEGAMYAWSGNDQVGEGKMTIVESKPNRLIGIKLEFIKPWTATNKTTFTFSGSGDTTKVTWAMDGENNFMAKAFSMFMDMDSMVGKDFEKGLSSLSGVAASEFKKKQSRAMQQ